MAYASWSVVFSEQPSAAKWNILGTNDASFNDGTGIGAGVITSESLNATIACRAYRNAALSLTAAGVKVAFDTENYDLGADFNTATGTFTAPVTGHYQVNACISVANLDAGGQIFVQIYVNGASYSLGRGAIAVASTDDPGVQVSDLVPVTAGQTIEIYGTTSTTESMQLGSTVNFVSIYFVGV